MHSAEIVLVIVTTSYILCGAQAGLAGFGGDYGEYLNLLKGNDVLDEIGGGGMDDIEAGQARQEAVMGGEEEELKDGFLRHLNSENKKKKDVHFHFDVNVLVVNKNMTPVDKPNNELSNPNLEKEIKFMDRDSSGGALPSAPKSEPFDWKKFQDKPAGQTGGGASGGWGGQTGGQAGSSPGGVPSSPPGSPAGGQTGNLGQRNIEESKEMRGMGGNWMRRRDSKPLPQQMVVILSPKAEVSDEVADKLEDAIKKDNKNIIYDIIRKMKKGRNKKMLEKERAQKEEEFIRAITEEEPSEVEEEIKEMVDNFISTYDDPMVITGHLTTTYHNLTMTGLSTSTICSMTHPAHSWKVSLCPDSLTATVSITSGPNMPFNGKVTAIYTNPHLNLVLTHTKDLIRLTSINLASDSAKFCPAFDSAVPLNPWSKVSLGGYMVAKAKKVLGKLVEKELGKAFKDMD